MSVTFTPGAFSSAVEVIAGDTHTTTANDGTWEDMGEVSTLSALGESALVIEMYSYDVGGGNTQHGTATTAGNVCDGNLFAANNGCFSRLIFSNSPLAGNTVMGIFERAGNYSVQFNVFTFTAAETIYLKVKSSAGNVVYSRYIAYIIRG